MLVSSTIVQLREKAPYFKGQVFGTLTLDDAMEQARPEVPAAFVLPPQERVSTSITANEHELVSIQRTLPIVVELSNESDRLGKVAADESEAARWSLVYALINWMPAKRFYPTQLSAFAYASHNPERAWFLAEFLVTEVLDTGCMTQEREDGPVDEFVWADVRYGYTSRCGAVQTDLGVYFKAREEEDAL